MPGMKQFGKKTPKKKPETVNQAAISLSKTFLKQPATDGFYSGDEKTWTLTLKYKFNSEFEKFVLKNSHIQEATWDILVEHLTDFSDEAFRFKRKAGSLNWSDAAAMVGSFNWKDA